MTTKLEIRESTPEDLAAIESLYPQAFPDEDLLPLVRELLPDPALVTSLVAVIDERVKGHGLFTRCGVMESTTRAALLGPLAVAPDSQRRGIGSAIVREGLHRMAADKVSVVCVLGDPAYYGRFGFHPEASIKPPYPVPEEWKDAWRSIWPAGDARPISGVMTVPPPWRNAALWGP